jgi:hypothetical protein
MNSIENRLFVLVSFISVVSLAGGARLCARWRGLAMLCRARETLFSLGLTFGIIWI